MTERLKAWNRTLPQNKGNAPTKFNECREKGKMGAVTNVGDA